MYEAFFGLRKKPFELVPDPEFIYLSRSHRKALIYLDYGIRERAGFILLTGDVGSGKTTLIRDILNKGYANVTLSKIFNTRVTAEQLLAMINDDFGLPVAGKDRVSLMRDLNDFLLEQYAAGHQPILIIDEAQNLEADLLEDIRMLSNLESAHGKLLQIVLVGQPELRETLAAPELLQLRQRISINCHLKALGREEMTEYVLHRMEVAGNREALIFPRETLDLVYQYSRGIPRLINIICDFLMLSAFAEEVREITLEMARDVVGDLDFEQHFWGGGEGEGPSTHSAVVAATGVTAQGGEIVAALGELAGLLALLRDDFNAHVEKDERAISELGANLARLNGALAQLEVQTNLRQPEVGLVRRLFGATEKP
ncbi:XrtA-associated ATPase [Geomonas sp. RF6]|uniref:XrtA/PEP-CTERM system-associated ATPase n=1 Tax=Geomonas sp. RF6 TaxID=2897342 RepID=UPI001E36FA78|nr:XrtA/PEP-CTERM system-associated ATPase [Geomonas sp. RF6]UFS69105.1 XrtA-associated ATPase [Geomonas sp. RF6]